MLDNYELIDRYRRESGRVFLTGTQALVRIPLMQRTMDAAAGLNTSGFVSGYRGSPLGAYDMELWRAKRYLDEKNIRFLPAVNEELAATAVLGSQQVEGDPLAQRPGREPGDDPGDRSKCGQGPEGQFMAIEREGAHQRIRARASPAAVTASSSRS